MKIYDITLPLTPTLPMWPGDQAFQFNWTMDQSAGDSVNVGAVTMSLHSGTHADAPSHVAGERPKIDEIDLSVYCGPCHLVDARGHKEIPAELLHGLDFSATPRLLLRTDGWLERTAFPTEIPVLAPDVPEFLAENGVRLVGLDVPSVDPIESKELPIHHALGKRNIHILESLDLAAPAAGRYELTALPLKIAGGDASPIRAILRGPCQDCH